MKPSQEILRKFALSPVPTRDWAIIRARCVQKEISHLRSQLDIVDPKGLLAVAVAEDARNAALLASYDAEMDRLCRICPAIMTVLLAESIGDLNEVP